MRYLTSIVAALIRSTSMNALQIYLNEVNGMQKIKQKTKRESKRKRESSIRTKNKTHTKSKLKRNETWKMREMFWKSQPNYPESTHNKIIKKIFGMLCCRFRNCRLCWLLMVDQPRICVMWLGLVTTTHITNVRIFVFEFEVNFTYTA